MIANKFSQALAPLLSTANIISPTSTLDKEAQLHLPADPTARPFDVSFKPNCDCHPSNIFSMIGYDITITNATPPPSSNQVLPSSIDCITNYTANADLSLQDHERNKLNRPNNRRTTPPISGDEVIGNLLHNQMILTPVAINAMAESGPFDRGGVPQAPAQDFRNRAGTHLTRLARRSAKNPKRKRQILAKIDFGLLTDTPI